MRIVAHAQPGDQFYDGLIDLAEFMCAISADCDDLTLHVCTPVELSLRPLLDAQALAETHDGPMGVFEVTCHALAIPGQRRAAIATSQTRIRQQPGNGLCSHPTAFGTIDRPFIRITQHVHTRQTLDRGS